MAPRFHVDTPLTTGALLVLPAGAARHVQVLRLQPGSALTLFNGQGGEWQATVLRMGRSEVEVQIHQCVDVDRELPLHITLAIGMPANDRMDALVEKATELGAATIQPLGCERSVLRLSGERADKKTAHWRAVATAASEQCGRTRVPDVAPVRGLLEWLRTPPADAAARRWVLSLREGGTALVPAAAGGHRVHVFLRGPEGGLTDAEEAAARAAGFSPASLGPRVLRADTAPLAALAVLAAAIAPA